MVFIEFLKIFFFTQQHRHNGNNNNINRKNSIGRLVNGWLFCLFDRVRKFE